MKKFNAKKVIVSGAVALLLVGGTVAAASGLEGLWAGSSDAKQTEQNLITLDEMLAANEKSIKDLKLSQSTLQATIDTLKGNISGLDTKITKLEEAMESNSTEVNRLLTEAEGYLDIDTVTSDTVTIRYTRIKNAGIVLWNEKVKAEQDLLAAEQSIERLTEEKSEIESDLAAETKAKNDLQTELNGKSSEADDLKKQLKAAKSDVEELKTKSSEVIEKHGGTVKNIETAPTK